MITGEQIEKCWEKPIPAIKKLNWHEPFKHGISKCINVLINGFRKDRQYLRIYYEYRHPKTGKIMYDSDISTQFKIKK